MPTVNSCECVLFSFVGVILSRTKYETIIIITIIIILLLFLLLLNNFNRINAQTCS